MSDTGKSVSINICAIKSTRTRRISLKMERHQTHVFLLAKITCDMLQIFITQCPGNVGHRQICFHQHLRDQVHPNTTNLPQNGTPPDSCVSPCENNVRYAANFHNPMPRQCRTPANLFPSTSARSSPPEHDESPSKWNATRLMCFSLRK